MNELDQKYVTRFSKIDSNYITLYHLPFDTLPIFSSKLTPWFDLYLVWREVTLRELKSWSLIFEHLTHRHFSKEFRSAVNLLWLVKCQVQFKLFLNEQLTQHDTHCLYRFLDNQKNTRSQFSVPGLREIHRNLKQNIKYINKSSFDDHWT